MFKVKCISTLGDFFATRLWEKTNISAYYKCGTTNAYILRIEKSVIFPFETPN